MYELGKENPLFTIIKMTRSLRIKNAETRDRLIARLLDPGGCFDFPIASNCEKRLANNDNDDKLPTTPKESQSKNSRKYATKKGKRIVKKVTSINPNKTIKKVVKVKVDKNSKKTKKIVIDVTKDDPKSRKSKNGSASTSLTPSLSSSSSSSSSSSTIVRKPSRLNTAHAQKVLLLGIVFATKEVTPSPATGQMYRDRVRCEAMVNLGYDVKTLDDKHDDDEDYAVECEKPSPWPIQRTAVEGTHCRANFSDPRRMWRKMKQIWGPKTRFDSIILDYFFCPEGYASVRWSENFFKETLPILAQRKILKSNGSIWLPNLAHVQEMLQKYRHILVDYFEWSRVKYPEYNPLYYATDKVEKSLSRCPDGRTNKTQLGPLHEVSDHIFFELKLSSSFRLSPTYIYDEE